MGRLVDIDTLRKEIEKRFWSYGMPLHDDAVTSKVDEILSLLDTLSEQQEPSLPSDLDEAAERYAWKKEEPLTEGEMLSTHFSPRINAFKAGAEWMAGQGWREVDSIHHPVPDKNRQYCVYTKEHYLLATVIDHPQDEELLQWKCTEFPNHRYDMCEGDKYFEIRKE